MEWLFIFNPGPRVTWAGAESASGDAILFLFPGKGAPGWERINFDPAPTWCNHRGLLYPLGWWSRVKSGVLCGGTNLRLKQKYIV